MQVTVGSEVFADEYAAFKYLRKTGWRDDDASDEIKRLLKIQYPKSTEKQRDKVTKDLAKLASFIEEQEDKQINSKKKTLYSKLNVLKLAILESSRRKQIEDMRREELESIDKEEELKSKRRSLTSRILNLRLAGLREGFKPKEYGRDDLDENGFPGMLDRVGDEVEQYGIARGRELIDKSNINHSYSRGKLTDTLDHIMYNHGLYIQNNYGNDFEDLLANPRRMDVLEKDRQDVENNALHFHNKDFGMDEGESRPRNKGEELGRALMEPFNKMKDEELSKIPSRETDYIEGKKVINQFTKDLFGQMHKSIMKHTRNRLGAKLAGLNIDTSDRYRDREMKLNTKPENMKTDQKTIDVRHKHELEYLNKDKKIRPKKPTNKDFQKIISAKLKEARQIISERKTDIEHKHTFSFYKVAKQLGSRTPELVSEGGEKYWKYWLLNAKQINGNGWGVVPETISQHIGRFKDRPFTITSNEWITNSEYGAKYEHPFLPTNHLPTIFSYQDKFKVGQITRVFKDDNDDYYAMIKPLSKYANRTPPPFCSPGIFQLDPMEHEAHLTKWEPLHLTGLDADPAYGAHVALLRGTCTGSEDACIVQFGARQKVAKTICPVQMKARLNVMGKIAALRSSSNSAVNKVNIKGIKKKRQMYAKLHENAPQVLDYLEKQKFSLPKMSTWIDQEGEMRGSGLSHYDTVRAHGDKVGVKAEPHPSDPSGQPLVSDENIHDFMKQTGLIRLQPHLSQNRVSVHVPQIATNSQLKSIRELEKLAPGLELGFAVGPEFDKMDFGTGYRDFIKSYRKQFPINGAKFADMDTNYNMTYMTTKKVKLLKKKLHNARLYHMFAALDSPPDFDRAMAIFNKKAEKLNYDVGFTHIPKENREYNATQKEHADYLHKTYGDKRNPLHATSRTQIKGRGLTEEHRNTYNEILKEGKQPVIGGFKGEHGEVTDIGTLEPMTDTTADLLLEKHNQEGSFRIPIGGVGAFYPNKKYKRAAGV